LPPALLALADGTVFIGHSIGATGVTLGEVVFNTALTGYQEILTDPSYCQQIVTLTYPHIGNYGINAEDVEATRVHAAGLVIKDLPVRASNFRQTMTLAQYLQRENVVAIAGIDTRRLTRTLRSGGAQNGSIVGFAAGARIEPSDVEQAIARARHAPSMAGQDLAKVVSATQPYAWQEPNGSSAAATAHRHRRVFTSWPTTTASSATSCACWQAAAAASPWSRHRPLRSMSGAAARRHLPQQRPGRPRTMRLRDRRHALADRQGPADLRHLPRPPDPRAGLRRQDLQDEVRHHGANHPVKDLDSGRVSITSQNHGFAVDEKTLPPTLRPTHVSLFDGTLQGLARTDKPAFCFQGHPEASPGPHDIGYLFDRFVQLMEAR
jgi:carbamoyl-phosphate synthase small subunit